MSGPTDFFMSSCDNNLRTPEIVTVIFGISKVNCLREPTQIVSQLVKVELK